MARLVFCMQLPESKHICNTHYHNLPTRRC